MGTIPQSCAVLFAILTAAGCTAEAQDAGQTDETTAAEELSGGGGCSASANGDPVSACISRQGNNVLPDFYLNAALDSSRYWYNVEVTRPPQSTWWHGQRRLDHVGHYGPDFVNIATMPWKSGCARTIVHLYTIDGTPHGTFSSPSVCY